MPVCTFHLLSLNVPLSHFFATLASSGIKPLLTARVIRWIITPTLLSTHLLLPGASWTLLLVLPTGAQLTPSLQSQIRAQWTVTAGIPSRLTASFETTNARLLHADSSTLPPLTGALAKPRIAASAQSLELTTELQKWLTSLSPDAGHSAVPGAVSMWNMLSFVEGKQDSYKQYGQAFAEKIGARRGGVAKIVGRVLETSDQGLASELGSWDEVAIAHYPSLGHFADMLASEDYQEVNHKFRVPALRDTFILCTSELDLPWPEKSKI